MPESERPGGGGPGAAVLITADDAAENSRRARPAQLFDTAGLPLRHHLEPVPDAPSLASPSIWRLAAAERWREAPA